MSCKAEDEGRLTPAEDENAAGRKIDRLGILVLEWFDYHFGETPYLTVCKSGEVCQRNKYSASFSQGNASFIHRYRAPDRKKQPATHVPGCV